MRKLFFVLFALLSFTTLAGPVGRPDQDPIVAQLRERYSKASQPNMDIVQSKTYTCTGYMAVRDNFKKDYKDMKAHFTLFDGIYTFKTDQASDLDMVLSDKELIGNKKSTVLGYDFNGTMAIRRDKEGYLLLEWSVHKDKKQADMLEPITVLKEIANVISYGVCVPDAVTE